MDRELIEAMARELRDLKLRATRMETHIADLESRLQNRNSRGRLIASTAVLYTGPVPYNQIYTASQCQWVFPDGLRHDYYNKYLGWSTGYEGNQALILGFATMPPVSVLGYWLVGKVNGVAVDWIFTALGPGIVVGLGDPGQISHTKINFAGQRNVLVRISGDENTGDTRYTMRGGYMGMGLPAGSTMEVWEARV